MYQGEDFHSPIHLILMTTVVTITIPIVQQRKLRLIRESAMTKVNWLLRGRGRGRREIASIVADPSFLLHPSLLLRRSLGTG